jgi:hypothetical protein
VPAHLLPVDFAAHVGAIQVRNLDLVCEVKSGTFKTSYNVLIRAN